MSASACSISPGLSLAEHSDPVLTESALLRSARAGETDAFGILVSRYQSRAVRLAARILRDDAAAEDAVQEAFIKAYSSLDRFEERARFYTWLYRLVVNECLDRKRRRVRERRVGWNESPVEPAEVPAPARTVLGVAFDPAVELTRAELRTALGDALGKLGDEARQVILLREVDGLSYAEIARVEDIPVGTVMSRLHYARRRLRALLRESKLAYTDESPS